MSAQRVRKAVPSDAPARPTLLRRGLAAAGVLGVAGALLAGCGSSSSTASDASSPSPSASAAASDSPSASPSASPSTSSSPATSANASPAPSKASAAPASASMSIKDYKYTVPASVKPGQKVTVKNNDPLAHSVTVDSGSSFNIVIPAGGSVSFNAPSKAGSYAFHCIFHGNMHGTLVVS